MKKRSKKYNPMKGKQSLAMQTLKHHVLAWCGTKKATFFNINTHKKVTFGIHTVQNLRDSYLPWRVWIVLLIREKNGKIKVVPEQLKMSACRASEVEEFVANYQLEYVLGYEHQELIVNTGWMITLDDNLTSKTILEIYENMGGFDFKAPFEKTLITKT